MAESAPQNPEQSHVAQSKEAPLSPKAAALMEAMKQEMKSGVELQMDEKLTKEELTPYGQFLGEYTQVMLKQIEASEKDSKVKSITQLDNPEAVIAGFKVFLLQRKQLLEATLEQQKAESAKLAIKEELRQIGLAEKVYGIIHPPKPDSKQPIPMKNNTKPDSDNVSNSPLTNEENAA